MMKWRVELSGDNGDLEELSKSLNSDKLRILRESEKYFLTSSDFNGITEAQLVRDKAKEILIRINNTTGIIQYLQKPISINGVESLGDKGERSQYIFPEPATAVARGYSPSVLIDGKVVSPPVYKDLSNLLQLAEANSTVARALSYLKSGSSDWPSLYNAFEVIKDDVGGEKAIQKSGWASMNQMERFRRTANSPDVIRDTARHGVPKGIPPKDPMLLNEARSFILQLVKCWLNSKIPN